MPGRHVLFANDLTGESLLFERPERLLVAWEPDEFEAVLTEAERARSNGRWLAGYLSYEAGFLLEKELRADLPGERRAPLACFGIFPAPSAPRDAAGLLQEPATDEAFIDDLRPAWSFDEYRTRFDRLRHHLRCGDCYQANLTFPITAHYGGEPLSLFNILRRRQPVAFSALVDLDGPAVVSRSPELFFRITRDGVIESRPMKGTAPRGTDAAEDIRLKRFLANDPKNRSENVMIVDLLRNDLSHVCISGSVEAPVLFHVDSYATLHQMISHVRGKLLPDAGLRDILAALFPCGSITGAPKISAMRILRTLEGRARDVYCGAVGWMAPTGAMEFNVAIRTVTLYEDGEAVFNVGGGIVFDSTAEAEYDECLLKARFATLPAAALA